MNRYGAAVRMSEGALDSGSIKIAERQLMDRLLGKKQAKFCRSKKQIIIPSSLEFVFKRPGPQTVADPYDLACILAAKVSAARFTKLKKFMRDSSHLLAPYTGKMPSEWVKI